MQCEEILNLLEEVAPKHYACEWDNVGLLVGDKKKEVRRIYLALDATDEVIEEAVLKQADLLLTHHPLIFSGQKQVVEDNFIGRRISKLIKNDISYCVMHTNFDVAVMADLATERILLQQPETLDVTLTENGREFGIGKVGMLSHKMTVKEVAELVKEKFELPDVKVFGDLHKVVQRAAISPGSGKSEVKPALLKHAEVLITGDIDHHDGIDAVAQGLCIIDAGHYGLEHIFMPFMKEYLEKRCDVPEVLVREHMLPFHTI